MFDATEYERWMATARDHLRVARHDADGGFYSAAVLQSEQATQCGLKALLHGVGQAQAARGHGLLSLAQACRQWAGVALSDDDYGALGRLARDYQPTRYPDALPEGTPMGHHGADDATWAETIADRILQEVSTTWRDLMREASAEISKPADDGST
jgi:HEPN domain-containing protein